jgi:hypothetical protein
MKITQKYDLIQGDHGLKVDLNKNKIADKNEPDFYLSLVGPQGEQDKFWTTVVGLQSLVAGKAYLPDSLLQKACCLGNTNENGFIDVEPLNKAFSKTDETGKVTEQFLSASAVLKTKDNADENGNRGTLKITTKKLD